MSNLLKENSNGQKEKSQKENSQKENGKEKKKSKEEKIALSWDKLKKLQKWKVFKIREPSIFYALTFPEASDFPA